MSSLNERVDALVEVGHLNTPLAREKDVVWECARRYVVAEHRKRERLAARQLERVVKGEAVTPKFREAIARIVTEFSMTLRAEWDAELLASTFALADGTRVVWGDATVDQHGDRAAMLESMATGDLRTAAIHRRAARDILGAGRKTLAEAVAA